MTRIIRLIKRYIRNKNIRKLTPEELIKLCFLILPYLKIIKVIKDEYNSNSSVDLFKDIVENIISQVDETNLDKCLKLIYYKKPTIKDLILDLPYFIHKNNLVEIFVLFKELDKV